MRKHVRALFLWRGHGNACRRCSRAACCARLLRIYLFARAFCGISAFCFLTVWTGSRAFAFCLCTNDMRARNGGMRRRWFTFFLHARSCARARWIFVCMRIVISDALDCGLAFFAFMGTLITHMPSARPSAFYLCLASWRHSTPARFSLPPLFFIFKIFTPFLLYIAFSLTPHTLPFYHFWRLRLFLTIFFYLPFYFYLFLFNFISLFGLVHAHTLPASFFYLHLPCLLLCPTHDLALLQHTRCDATRRYLLIQALQLLPAFTVFSLPLPYHSYKL